MIKRWMEERLRAMMQVRRGVNLTGARQVGKTTLANCIELPDMRRYTLDNRDARRAAADDPHGFVKHGVGETLVIDEVQKVPDLLDAIKIILDGNADAGQYLLTGSSNLRFAKAVRDSLAGRLGWIRLRSLALGEIRGNEPRFMQLAFMRNLKRVYDEIDKRDAIHLAFEGGYPEPREYCVADRVEWYRTYLDDLLTKDVGDVTEIRKVPVLNDAAIWLLARSSQFFTMEELATKTGLSKVTVDSYLSALQALYLFDRVPAFAKTDYELVGKRPKWVATDAALMANILGWDENDVYLDEHRSGRLVETWVYQQLAALADAEGGYAISHYRDAKKREIDFLVEREDGALLGIEVKTGTVSAADFKHLKWFAANVARTPFTGLVVHSGKDVLSFGEGFFAIPFGALAE